VPAGLPVQGLSVDVRRIITTIIVIIMTRLPATTTSYQIETPEFLWRAFQKGPAEDYQKAMHRLTVLQARDVLENAPEQLDEEERERVEEIAEGEYGT
jgi:hypothetical protein